MIHDRQLATSILATCQRMRWHLLFVSALYVASFCVGYVAIGLSLPFAVDLRNSLLRVVSSEAPFTTVIETLRAGNLLTAILLTFVVNLTSGAFFSTTFPGVIPFIGSVGISLVTGYRGFSLGVIYHAVLSQSPAIFALGAGTLILELGGYVFSGAAGIALSLSTIFPERYGAESRWNAFKKTWTDIWRLYIVVVILLFAGAIWEMAGLFLFTR